MKLVIAEKPSVGAAIAAVMGANEKRSGYFEGGGYLVSWCIGHLISLADAATYNEQFRKWKYDDLPIVPQEWQFIVASGKEQQFSILKDLMHRSDVTEIINACDSGREGELIFRFVYEQANCKKPFSRLWISSMEASAIREGFSNLKDGRGYDNLYQSALCRAKADWLIGINATRLFSILYHKTLNVGRVQTPTLAMLVNRDYAISSFKKEKYHVVRLDVGGVAALSERQDDEAAARQMKAACEKSQAVCTSLKDPPHNCAQPRHIIPADPNFEKKRNSSALFAREINLVTQPSFDCEQGINSQVQTAYSNADAIFPVLGIVFCKNERFFLLRKTHVPLWNAPRISHVRLP